jgi:hypothetical protein
VLEMKNCDPDQLSIGPCSHRAVEFGEMVRLIAGRLSMSTRCLADVQFVKFFRNRGHAVRRLDTGGRSTLRELPSVPASGDGSFPHSGTSPSLTC